MEMVIGYGSRCVQILGWRVRGEWVWRTRATDDRKDLLGCRSDETEITASAKTFEGLNV